jgi:ABC-2 type transport system ATP-binding protein
MGAGQSLIVAENLEKSFGEVRAAAGVSFEVREGEIFGLLGPNGAGKTTTIHCICGLTPPSAGRVRVGGADVQRDRVAARRQLGLVPQELALYESLSARENVEYWGGVFGLRGTELRRRVEEALEVAGLADRGREPAGRFSGGMKRRLNFACGIVHRPRVLLLDEPTVGVDPQSRARLLDLVREQARAGVAVLYTTHYMEEAEHLCDRLAIIDHGRIIAMGTLGELRAMTGGKDLLRVEGRVDGARAAEAAARSGGVEVLRCEEGLLVLRVEDGAKRLELILEELRRSGAEVRSVSLEQPSLESLFLQLTGRELRE